jgi:hypothetical protein
LLVEVEVVGLDLIVAVVEVELEDFFILLQIQ